MDTFCSIQAEAEEPSAAAAVEKAFLELKRIEALFSRYISDSQISKLNEKGADSPVKLNKEAFRLIAYALQISRMTNGAFDITVGAAVDCWRLSQNQDCLPSTNQLQELQTRIGFENLHLDYTQDSVFFAKPGMYIDLGALAKGYGLNRIITILKEEGIERALVNLGGNIYVLNMEPQIIAVRHPVFTDEAITTVKLMNTSISTSANYERCFTVEGRKFGHLINPLTGCPAESEILSVSIISSDAAFADALSTAVFISGYEKGRGLLDGLENAGGVIIYKGLQGKVEVYNNLKENFLK